MFTQDIIKSTDTYKQIQITSNLTVIAEEHSWFFAYLCSQKHPHICTYRNLYAGQEATVRTGHGTTDWFQIGKGVHQGYILPPCLFNLYVEYIIQNARLQEPKAGFRISGRIINNLRYVDDSTRNDRK